MRRRKLNTGIAAAAAMLVLILDSKTALDGAVQGLELCIRTVIPSLFPFILLSNVLTGAFSGIPLPVLRPLGKLFSLPEGAEPLLIPAFLGGYPVGAQSIGAAYTAGQLGKEDAQRLLAFCNNAGPSFLFGMAGAMFPRSWMVWALWGIQIISALMVSFLFPCHAGVSKTTLSRESSRAPMASAVAVMGTICGWVVIFRVGIAFLDRWFLWLLPAEARVAVMGILELSNGCCALGAVESIPTRFVLCSAFLSFGGLCVTMQTQSVIPGLSIRNYLIGKGLQCIFSLLLAMSLFRNLWALCAILGVLIVIIPQKIRKRSSNPLSVGV